MTALDHMIYALLWLSFGVGHSLLAGWNVKRSLQHLVKSAYRLFYNLLATLHIGLVILVGDVWLSDNARPFEWMEPFTPLLIILQLLGVGILLVALSHYDLGRFAGTTQIRTGERETDEPVAREPLHTGGLHRWVRHPLYLGAFLILWPRATDEFALATAIWASLYFIIGAKFEERRLIALYGSEYQDYQRRVPMIVPNRFFPT